MWRTSMFALGHRAALALVPVHGVESVFSSDHHHVFFVCKRVSVGLRVDRRRSVSTLGVDGTLAHGIQSWKLTSVSDRDEIVYRKDC